MSIGPVFPPGGAAGTPPAPGKTVDAAEREGHGRGAESAPPIGAPDGERLRAEDRDVDGRRAWEPSRERVPDEAGQAGQPHPRAVDPSGQCGSQLDLTA